MAMGGAMWGSIGSNASSASNRGDQAGQAGHGERLRLVVAHGPTGEWLQALLAKAIITNSNPVVRRFAVVSFVSDADLFADDAIRVAPSFVCGHLLDALNDADLYVSEHSFLLLPSSFPFPRSTVVGCIPLYAHNV